MANRAYLTVCDHERIYPWLGDLPFDPARDVALASDGCIPVLWMCLFSAGDLRTHRFTLEGRPLEAVAPLAERAAAVTRLRSRAPALERWFAEQGGVAPFVELLAAHLDAQPGTIVSMELEEIEALHGEYDMVDVMRTALTRLEAEDESCLRLLLPLSTLLRRRFLPPAEAALSEEREDRWNVYRLIGGGWLLPTPWDDLDSQAELHRKLNASRRRGPFDTRKPA